MPARCVVRRPDRRWARDSRDGGRPAPLRKRGRREGCGANARGAPHGGSMKSVASHANLTNMNSAASTVRYSAPVDAAEAALRFRVLELRGDRVLIELLDSGM